MRIKLQVGMRLKLLRPKEWELGRVEAGTEGEVFQPTLSAGTKVFALFFQGREFTRDVPHGTGGSGIRTMCYGLPPEVSAQEYEVVGGAA